MSDNVQPLGQVEDRITDEYLDEFLAVGAEELRGLEILPEGRRDSQRQSEFSRGNVLPAVYLDVSADAGIEERLGALMFSCWKGSAE
ncbi:MAG: hypothetical protein LBP38_00695 [Desulfovibrio sp.]|jgi:hypothetical protein|nr:hypothetical protein [Desulfovibrio sp.]